jgi:hypothetical protein
VEAVGVTIMMTEEVVTRIMRTPRMTRAAIITMNMETTEGLLPTTDMAVLPIKRTIITTTEVAIVETARRAITTMMAIIEMTIRNKVPIDLPRQRCVSFYNSGFLQIS